MLNFIKAFGVFICWSTIGLVYLHYSGAFEKYKAARDNNFEETIDAISGEGAPNTVDDTIVIGNEDVDNDSTGYANQELLVNEMNSAIKKNEEAAVEEQRKKDLELKKKEEAKKTSSIVNTPPNPNREIGDFIYPGFDYYNEPLKDTKNKNIAKVILQKLQDNPAKKILIIGHTDHIGSNYDNYLIALQRAKGLKNYMIEVFNVDPARINIDSKGENEPIYQKNDPKSDLNNRIEVVLK